MSMLAEVPGISPETRRCLEGGGMYTVLELQGRVAASPRPRLATGLPGLDKGLGGGLQIGALTEIVGPAGLGKTQFCMTAAAAAAAAAGPGELVLYIDAEHKLVPSRLVEIARARGLDGSAPASALLERVLVLSPNDLPELLGRLQTLDVGATPLALIVVDSVAQLGRPSGADNAAETAARLAALAGRLKLLAGASRAPALAVNQVTGWSGELSAALGTLWAHAVDTRLVLHQLGDGTLFIQLAKSQGSPISAWPYRITAAGPEELSAQGGPHAVPDHLLDPALVFHNGGRISHAGVYSEQL
ncbi:hypothetical protein QBZ16_004516 [Prototheca wickerhamii]|uniref:RecA family profile 1 domain-containing protein n=1 Tax=Prototheca wickerhamii TaxID=3111 RepID=A0AAD9MK85_PROWI|nr:hypothetical protein QBZ16_004516 [Prototheca wickerhamii]